MTMMKASRIHDYGGPEVMHYEDAEKPAAAAGEVLVRVRGASVNPVDWKIRSGFVKAIFETKFPAILGGDLAGVVEAVGEDISDWKVGDEVFAHIGLAGANAQYVATKAAFCAPKPKSLNFEYAAAVPLTALTAWLGMVETAKVAKGQRVLIHAAAGGVGAFAVQFAKNAGAYVIGTASTENHAFLKSMGVDECIDYKTTEFEGAVKDIDVVFDLIGGKNQTRSYAVIKPGGMLVSATSPIDKEAAEAAKVNGVHIFVRPNGKTLAQIGALIDAGKIKVEVAKIFPLSQADQAFELSKTNRTRGKIALTVE
jgi:NADPH:quinone reductase-like Zn-dependent oxidoreductase